MRRLLGALATILCLFATSAALSGAARKQLKSHKPADAAAMTTPARSCTQRDYDADRAKLQRIELEEAGAKRLYYVFQGDLLVTSNQLRPLWLASCRRSRGPIITNGGQSIELKVMLDANGNRAIWPHNARHLTYAVDRSTFPTQAEYDEAVAAMVTASGDWQAACPQCGITLTHRADLDNRKPKIASGDPKVGEVTFIVAYLPNPSDSGLIASAFFPNDPLFRRRLYIAPSFYTSSFRKEGVVRHELGHVLGYRHEHVGVPNCPREDFQWEALGQYTKNSVMHYPCAGGGSLDLAIVDEDRRQHRLAYTGS